MDIYPLSYEGIDTILLMCYNFEAVPRKPSFQGMEETCQHLLFTGEATKVAAIIW